MIIFTICAVVAAIGLALHAIQFAAVRSTLLQSKEAGRRRSPAGEAHGARQDVTPHRGLPPLSILKPLSGLDDNLFDNLASFCVQDYPSYEIIFCLQDANDSSHKVARMVRERYPDRNITILVQRMNAGLNPKVNNLLPAYRAAQHEYVLISDSNVSVGPDYLRKIMKHMADPSVGLVSNLIRGVGGRSFGAVLENLHLNSFILGSVCLLDRVLGMPCVIGKSMLMRRSALDGIGGLAAFKDLLAEDFIIGREIDRAGYRVVLSNYLINNVNEFWGLRRFLNRHTRWGKLRWRIGGVKYLSELLGNPIFISALPLVLWKVSAATSAFTAVVSALKTLIDYGIGRMVSQSAPDREEWPGSGARYLLMPLKDILIGFLWFVPIFSNTVAWRGNRYLIGRDSRLSPVPASGIWSWRYRLTDRIRERFA